MSATIIGRSLVLVHYADGLAIKPLGTLSLIESKKAWGMKRFFVINVVHYVAEKDT